MNARRAAGALGLSALLAAPEALASLTSDVEALARRYREAGADVVRPRVRFLTSGASLPLSLPALPARPCTTVTVLGAPSTVFALRVPREDAAPELVGSAAGAAMVSRCGPAAAELDGLTVDVRSPHAILETIVASSQAPLDPVEAVLPHRDPGPVPPLERPGPVPAPAPVAQRAEALVEAYRREGADDVEQRFVPADPRGAGRLLIALPAGCHRVAVLGVSSGAEATFRDVDAELAWVTGETADLDRAESPDATLRACNGSRALAMLSFAGAPPDVPVLVVRATSPLPGFVPGVFGEDARARLGEALLARRAPHPRSPALDAFVGLSGVTRIPLELTPGRCYLAALLPIRGTAKLLTLETSLEAGAQRSHGDDGEGGVVLVACGRTERRAVLEVQAHGQSFVWGLAVWPLSSRRLGEEQP